MRNLAALAVSVGLFAPVPNLVRTDDVPKPIVDLKPGTAHYAFKLEAAGQMVTMDVTRITKGQNNNWVVSETTTTEGHVQTDEVTVEKKTLIIRKRVFRAGAAFVDLQFSGRTVTGVISEGTQKLELNRDLGTVIFADGGGGEDVLAALPLAKNYSTEFRNFNIGSQLVKTLQLRVIDDETVTVPAGTFDTWKALIISLDGGSDTYALWVDKRSHRVVKVGMSIPNMGDALVTGELTN